MNQDRSYREFRVERFQTSYTSDQPFEQKIKLKQRKNNGVLIAAKKLYFIVAGIRLIVIILVSKVIGQCIWRHAPRGRRNKGGQHSHT